MFNRLKKISFLLTATGFLVVFSPFVKVCAADTLIKPQSAEEFINDNASDEIKAAMEATKHGEIFCGSYEYRCTVDTQVCWKCSYIKEKRRWLGITGSQTKITAGKCMDKNAGPPTDWSDIDQNCNRTKRESYGAYFLGQGNRYYAATIEKSEGGFLKSEATIGRVFGHWDDTAEESFEKFCSNDGRCYSMKQIGDTVLIVNEKSDKDGPDTGGAFQGCEVLPVKLYNMQGCFFCPLSALIMGAANAVTINAFNIFSYSFSTVVLIVFAVWLALMALGQVFSVTKQDAPKFLSAILKQGFKVSIVFFLLFNANQLFTHFINPIISGGMQLGLGIQTNDLPTPTRFKRSDPKTAEIYYNARSLDGNKTLYEKIEEYLAGLQWRLAILQTIGTTLFCVGSHKLTFWNLITDQSEIATGLRLMTLGGVMTTFAFLLTMAFGFYFLDALLQLAVIGAMLPFMIASWPLKITAQYASTGFKMLLNTFFVMFFTGFVISVNVELVNQSFATAQELNADKNGNVEKTEDEERGLALVVKAINEQNIGKLETATDIGFSGFMLLIFSCIFGFKFVAETAPLANKLSAGGFGKDGIASKIGTMAASKIKGFAGKAAAPISRGIGKATGGVGGIATGAAGAVAKGAGGLTSAAGRGLSKAGKAVSGKGGALGKGVGGLLKFAGGAAQIAGKTTSAVGQGASNISKSFKAQAGKGK